MKLKIETKEITLKLKYVKSVVDKENGVYYGGVEEPKYLDELVVDVDDDYDFDVETEEFIKNGMFKIEISGTKRALKEMGKFLINMSMFQTEDEDYHEHIDQLQNNEGKPIANMTIKKF